MAKWNEKRPGEEPPRFDLVIDFIADDLSDSRVEMITGLEQHINESAVDRVDRKEREEAVGDARLWYQFFRDHCLNAYSEEDLFLSLPARPYGAATPTISQNAEHSPSLWYHSSMTAQQILEQALQLNEEERIVVASSLLESVETPPPDRRTDAEWIAEIERRARAALAGSPGLTWAEARARIEERLDLQ